ncbi:MAG: FAD-dependent oxidoreductase, partial [Nitrospiraceae bacterium]
MVEPNTVRIVILGGGFAGVAAAKELQRLTRGDQSIAVHLVNEENYFVFQPLIPGVVSCAIEPVHILNPIRQLCPRVQFHCGTVAHVDRDARTVTVMSADEKRLRTLPFDHLIWSLGLKTDFSRVPGMPEHAYPLKTLGDAFHLRNQILSCLEEADQETDEALRQKGLTIVTIGGGFSGVETIAELNDMMKTVLPFYPRAARTGHRAILIHSGDRILHELDAGLSAFAQAKLEARGVQVHLKVRVKEVSDDGVTLSTGETIPTGTVVCTVGNSPHPLVTKMELSQEGGRLRTDEYLRVPGTVNLWAVGDAALVPDLERGGVCPPTAQYAMREGVHCAKNVLATIRREALRPFRFGGLGQLASVGHRTAVGRILGVRIAGFLAWLLWRGTYLAKVPGLRCKVRVATDWALDLLFPRDIAKIDLRRTEQLARAHYREGDVIVRQGEIGNHFYIIESGQVEIIREDPGEPPKSLGIRGAGTSFGEIALLKEVPRTATVRCLTPVDVVKFARRDFLTLTRSHDAIRGLLEKETHAILEKEAHSH